MMIRTVCAALAVAGSMAAACPATAAVVIDIDQMKPQSPFGNTGGTGLISQSFTATRTNIAGAGFNILTRGGASATVTYSLYASNPAGAVALASASAVASGRFSAAVDAFFASPVALTIGQVYFLAVDSASGPYVNDNGGDTYSGGGAYSGTALVTGSGNRFPTGLDLAFRTYYDDAFVPAAPGAVPEPAAWAMMLAGFGLMGAAMRRRRVSVRYA